jgi:putative nucleotidyltransferase with HDIG domain
MPFDDAPPSRHDNGWGTAPMPAATLQPPQSFCQRYQELPELKPLPVVATRLMQACQDAKSNSKAIARIIECDPGVALKLMKIANSAMYGVSGRIRTVDQAIVLLGFRAVRDLAVSLAGAEVFREGESAKKERLELWRHSLACATVARALAREVRGVVPEEAFLAGIFHDVGKLLFFDLVPDEYLQLRARRSGAVTPSVEAAEFGASHTEIGLQCGDEWGLPEPVRHAIGFHHAPDDAPDHRALVAVTQLANRLAKCWQLNGEDAPPDPPTAEELAASGLGLDAPALERVRERVAVEFAEVKQICGD